MTIRVHLTGAFKVIAEGGEDLTPKGTKECALLALLVTSQAGERGRGWLQAMLWSERGKDQAAASLRQAVSQIRRSFSGRQDCVISNRRTVGLRMDMIETVETPGFDFLEGLDVRDDEFEYWLSAERSTRDGPGLLPEMDEARASEPQKGRVLSAGARALQLPTRMMVVTEAETPSLKWFERQVADMVVRTLGESFSLPVVEQIPGELDNGAWKAEISSADLGQGKLGLRLSLTENAQQRKLWSSMISISPTGVDNIAELPDLLNIVRELSSVVSEKLCNDVEETSMLNDADMLCSMAIKKLFSMTTDQVSIADRLLARAFELRPRGLYLAWRAQVREIQFIERMSPDLDLIKDECLDFARRAVDLEPRNATVLAILAITRLHMSDDLEGALEFARRSVLADYSNPVAWWSFGAAHVAYNDTPRAYECARIAVQLARGTPLEFWAKSQLAGASIAMRRLDEAKGLMKSVALSRPNFRPPMRYLIALHATHEEWDEAMALVQKLSDTETGFSVDQLLNDTAYPSTLLRLPYGLDRDRIGSLA